MKIYAHAHGCPLLERFSCVVETSRFAGRGGGGRVQRAALDDQRDARAFVVADGNRDEGRGADEVDSTGFEIVSRDGDGFDRLVDCARADGLQFGAVAFAKGRRERPRDGVGTALRRDFSH
jgi:hypothetical protein